MLAIDTSLACCQAGVFRDGVALAVTVEPMSRGHQEALPPMVETLLATAGISPRDIDLVAVTLGPGSFTGVRVGLSFAKGLASGLGRPLKGVGSLEALNRHPDLAEKQVLSVIHGGRGSIYAQVGFEPPRGFSVDLAAAVDVLTGPAAEMVREHAPRAEIFAQEWPALDALAASAMLPGHDDLTPLYMRDADAVVSTRGIITLEGA